MARVIHTADTHIGYRQYHSPERRRDFLTAFESVVADAIDEDVDAVIHAGDLFHDTRPDLDDLMETIRVLRDLSMAEIPFLGIVGNHERTQDRQWMDLMSDLDLGIRLDDTGTRIGDVTFYGLDWLPPTQRDRLDYTFAPPDTEAAVLVSHGLFEPFAHADWDTEHLLQSTNVDFDALLLGDNHIADRAEVEDTWVTYPGSTERTSADEREQRGYNVVSVDRDVRISRRSIEDIRPFEFVDVTLASNEGFPRVRDQILERNIDDAVVIVRIEGAGADIAPAKIEQAATDAGALIVRVIDTREREEPSDRTAVQFSDPDRAVTQEIDGLGMSEVGHMVDAIVRDDTIPDSGVRERVHTRIETLLAEEPAAFERESTSTIPANESEDDSGQTSIGEY